MNIKFNKKNPPQELDTTAGPQSTMSLEASPQSLSQSHQDGGIGPSLEETARIHDGSHFDELLGGPDEAAQVGPSTRLSKEDYHRLICGGLKTASILTGLKSLDIEENDERNRKGTEAIYDTIAEIPALHFLLNPAGKWMDRTMSIVIFVMPIAQGCRMEIMQRRAGPPSAPVDTGSVMPRSEGAPDDQQRAILNRV